MWTASAAAMDARPNLSRMPTLRPHHARPLRSLALPTTLALLLALAGCSNTAEIPRADPSPSASPLFASEDEALEAATAVYEEYLAVLDSALADPTFDYSALESLAEDKAREVAIADIESFRQDGLRITGPRALVSTELQLISTTSTGSDVAMYACEDVSGVNLVNAAGESLSSEGRPDRSLFEVVVSITPADLVVTSRILWDGQSAC